MICFLPGLALRVPAALRSLWLPSAVILVLTLTYSNPALAQKQLDGPQRSFFIDCSAGKAGDGSSAHPWSNLSAPETHSFNAGDRIALARGTVCHGSFAPRGSGAEGQPIRLTAYGRGPRPRIVASPKDRKVLGLFNQEYWQIDSLDLSGASTYGVFVSGDKGTLHHIHLKNLFVHDVMGGAPKNKDNGLVVVGPSSVHAIFTDVLVDGVIAAHTNQWAGILIGGGGIPFPPEAPLNSHVTVRNSSVQDVFGDGIILFRDSDGLIESSTAWQTGMQPTQDIGTPNAIWTWTCTDCRVEDNEAFLTDSPGVDGGAYDIDWANTRNTIQRNFAHDTQGYCLAVFAAGYVTSESVVRDNLCIDNGLSPRLAALQGAVYLLTWNGGVIRNLHMEHNTIVWNPPVAAAAAVVNSATIEGAAEFTANRIESSAPIIYRSNAQLKMAANFYSYSGAGDAKFTIGDRHDVPLAALQAAGLEEGTTLQPGPLATQNATGLRLEATVELTLDADGLIAADPRAQLMVLRGLAAQYNPPALRVTVHLRSGVLANLTDQANAMLDLDAGSIRFDHEVQPTGVIRLLTNDGSLIQEWHGFQNAASLGGAVRSRLGPPRFAAMPMTTSTEDKQ